MKQAVLRTTTESLRSQFQPGIIADREILRAIAADLDILGVDPEGASWALVRTTPELLQYLAEMDAGTEDAEEGDFTIEQNPRMVHEEDEDDGSAEDIGDFEPDFRDNPPVLLGGAS